MQRLREHCAGRDVHFDQCGFGLEYKKPTQVVTNAANLHQLRRFCQHIKGEHEALRGRTPSGEFRSKTQSRYPVALCQELSKVFLSQRARDLQRGHWSTGDAWERLRGKFGPELGTLWHPFATAVGAAAVPCLVFPGGHVQEP